jgi:hypothetical protein
MSKIGTRPVYEFEIPTSLGCPLKSVCLVELTVEEELQATKRARGDQFRLAWELARQSLVMVDGKAVTTADDTSDRAWEAMPPTVRQLVLGAYADLHQPQDDAVTAFRASRKVRVG